MPAHPTPEEQAILDALHRAGLKLDAIAESQQAETHQHRRTLRLALLGALLLDLLHHLLLSAS